MIEDKQGHSLQPDLYLRSMANPLEYALSLQGQEQFSDIVIDISDPRERERRIQELLHADDNTKLQMFLEFTGRLYAAMFPSEAQILGATLNEEPRLEFAYNKGVATTNARQALGLGIFGQLKPEMEDVLSKQIDHMLSGDNSLVTKLRRQVVNEASGRFERPEY